MRRASEPDQQRGDWILALCELAGSGWLERVKACCEMEPPRYILPPRFDVRESSARLPSGKHDVAALGKERKSV